MTEDLVQMGFGKNNKTNNLGSSDDKPEGLSDIEE